MPRNQRRGQTACLYMLAFFSLENPEEFGNPEKKRLCKEGIGLNHNTLLFLVSMEHMCLLKSSGPDNLI